MSARKAYRPKPVHLNAVQRAIEAAQLLPTRDRAALLSIAQRALDELRFGRGQQDAWRDLADCFNVAEALAGRGICSDEGSRGAIAEGQAALEAVHAQAKAGRGWTLRAEHVRAFEAAIERHAIQLRHCSLREYQGAVDRVKEQVRQALQGNAPSGVAVLSA